MPAHIAADGRAASTASPPAGAHKMTPVARAGAAAAPGNVVECRQ